MKAKTLNDWLITQFYYESESPNLVILKENDKHSEYGISQMDAYMIDKIDYIESENRLNIITKPRHDSVSEPKWLFNTLVDDVNMTIDRRDFELGDIGRSERTYYLNVFND